VNYSTVWNGQVRPVDGTSAATPAAAAIIALVNDALLSSGKSTLGFLNPWLYQGGYTAFTDVLSGSSAGCETKGFTAGPGWDAVTGFGTPVSFVFHYYIFSMTNLLKNFPKILEHLGVGTNDKDDSDDGDDDDGDNDDDDEDGYHKKNRKTKAQNA
jgi:subtilase family serine protease